MNLTTNYTLFNINPAGPGLIFHNGEQKKMKKLSNVNYLDLEAAAINNGYELIDSIDESLCDSVLYEKPETETKQSILIAGFETYLNCWSSCLTVYIARTENDRKKLMRLWNERQQETE